MGDPKVFMKLCLLEFQELKWFSMEKWRGSEALKIDL